MVVGHVSVDMPAKGVPKSSATYAHFKRRLNAAQALANYHSLRFERKQFHQVGEYRMPINLRAETLIPFCKAPAHIPGRPHISTLHRWRLGVRGRKLETIIRGGRRFTSLEAIHRFMYSDDYAQSGASADREQRAQSAETELSRLGL